MRKSCARLSYLATVLTLVSVLSTAAFAERARPLKGTPPEKVFEALKRDGIAIVIVGLETGDPWVPEPRLSNEHARQRRADLRARKQALAERHPKMKMLAGRDYPSLPSFAASVDEAAYRALMRDDDVSSITVSGRQQLALAQSIPIVRAGSTDIPTGERGDGQVVAVVDTGVSSGHRFLTGKVVAEGCFTTTYSNSGGSLKTEESCPNQSASHGAAPYSVPVSEEAVSGSGEPCIVGSTIPNDCKHGTRVAGVAVGKDDGNTPTIGFNGVAREADLIAVNVASLKCADTNNPCGSWETYIWDHDVVAALVWIYDDLRGSHSIAAVNLSMTNISQSSSSVCTGSAYQDAIDDLHGAGIAVVAATGNHSTSTSVAYPGPPACVGNAIAVGATTDLDVVASYSNSATYIDLLAPGGLSSTGDGIESSVPGNGFAELYGTSFAAPHVAGAFAILRQEFPSSTTDQLLTRLKDYGFPITDTRAGLSRTTSRLDVKGAIDGDNQAPTTPASFTASATSRTAVHLSWSASTDNVGVTGYVLEYKTLHSQSSWTALTTTTSTSYDHDPLSEGAVYRYRIRATDAAGNYSTEATDFATTVIHDDDPVSGGATPTRGMHLARLREAADAWRIYAGRSRAFSTPYTAQTGAVTASYLTAVVTALNEARGDIGLSSFAYSGTAPGSGNAIGSGHVQQLRNAMN
jgi:subtilisin family serine protease